MVSLNRERTLSSGYDVVIVGSGLSGLMAAWLAGCRGARVVVVARGVGALPLSTGCIDVLGYTPNGEPITNPGWWLGRAFKSTPSHPYQLAGREALEAGLEALQAIHPLRGSLRANFLLPTAVGALRPTCLAPATLARGDPIAGQRDCLLVGFGGWRDLDAEFAAANLGIRAVDLSLPDGGQLVNATAVDIAHRFERPDYRTAVAQRLRPHLGGVARVGFPAVLGLDAVDDVVADLEALLGVTIFEIPTLPPSIPGMRLYRGFLRALRQVDVDVTLGPTVHGWVQGDRTLGVRTYGASGERSIAADAVILATGGLLNGGLEIGEDGTVRESVFDLPVKAPPAEEFFSSELFAHHPVTEAGLRVNPQMQVLDAMYSVVYPNVYAIGGVLAGADRLGEASTQGIDIATAWRAVETLTQ